MILEIMKYRLVCDVAAGGEKVAPRPEMTTPVTFAKFWELHLNAMRRAPFDTANEVADRDMRCISTSMWTCSLDKPRRSVPPVPLQTRSRTIATTSSGSPSIAIKFWKEHLETPILRS